jgi:hypothetical protein
MVLVDGALEDAVHHALKRGGRISEAEEHDVRHKDAELHLKSSFMAIFPPDTDIVVSLAHVELGENAGILDASNSWGNKQHWIEVSLCQCVCFLIVLDWPVRTILLLEVEEGRGDVSLVWVCMFDVPPGQHVVEPSAEVSPFPGRGGVYLAVEGFRGAWLEVDSMVPGMCRRKSMRFLFTEDLCVLLIFSGYRHWFGVLSCFCGKVGGYPLSVGALLLELLEDCQFVGVGESWGSRGNAFVLLPFLQRPVGTTPSSNRVIVRRWGGAWC